MFLVSYWRNNQILNSEHSPHIFSFFLFLNSFHLTFLGFHSFGTMSVYHVRCNFVLLYVDIQFYHHALKTLRPRHSIASPTIKGTHSNPCCWPSRLETAQDRGPQESRWSRTSAGSTLHAVSLLTVLFSFQTIFNI